MVRTEKGVLIMKDGLAWGIVRKGDSWTEYGWVAPEDAPMHSAEFCTKPSDITYEDDHNMSEIMKGKIVRVERTTTTEIKIVLQ